jgi:hypothetical protein
MFGKYMNPTYDADKEERRGRLIKVMFGGLFLCGSYLWFGGPFATQVFQAWVATSLFYGDNFYVLRCVDIQDARVWKAILTTLPFHCTYLAALFWLDHTLPKIMPKAVVFMPIIAIGFACESLVTSKLLNRYLPRAA